MSGLLAIARRDLLSTFLVPTGWIVLAAWGLIASLVFMLATFGEGQPATLRAVVSLAGWALLIVAPAISMRSFAEESRQGTLEILLSSPRSAFELVAGKLLAAVAVLAVLSLPILVLAGITEIYGDPDFGELACGLLGLLLYGTTLVSIGILVSTRTSSQVVAYLVTFFVWFILVLVAKGLPAMLPELVPATLMTPDRVLAWVDALRSMDPMLRLDEFAIGLLDTSNVAYFVAMTIVFVLLSAISLSAPRRPRGSGGGAVSRGFSSVLGIAGLATAGVAMVVMLSQPVLRWQADLTKTRAYSLQPATVDLLDSLEEGWTVRMFVAEDDADPVTMRLVDEVVQRMDEVTPSLSAERIDPVDPGSIARYETVLEEFVARDAATIDTWETEIERGLDAFEDLRLLAGRMGAETSTLLDGIAPGLPVREPLERIVLVFGTLAEEGGRFTEYIEDALRSSLQRPLPAWRLARASVAANNANQATELERLVDAMRAWSVDPVIPIAVRDWANRHLPEVEAVTGELRSSAASLESLERRLPLPIAIIAESVAEGDVAVVDGPFGSTVIPAWQLFPSQAIRDGDDDVVVGFDRRFRGEETLASAIRALRIGTMPRVVLVHPEERTMLRPTDSGLDYSGIVDALRIARYEVTEWIPGRTERPVAQPGRTTVWLVMPALQRQGLEYSDAEKATLEAARTLIEEGSPVLLTVARSLIPMVGQEDPWSTVAAAHGVRIDTGRVIFEWSPDLLEQGEDGSAVRVWQAIDGTAPRSGGDSAADDVADALRGKRLLVAHTSPVDLSATEPESTTILAAVEPGPLRWIESDWRGDGARIVGPPSFEETGTAERIDRPVPVAVAVTPDADDAGLGRLVVVGSGSWGLSAFVNEAGSLGDQRLVLANPGNRELALSGVAWLAGLDELVATGSSGREVSRFQGVGSGTRNLFAVLLPLLLGVGPLATGMSVWAWRRAGR